LVERARQLLAVDTATVLLVDRSGMQLVAKAASGLEEEVFQGVRIPVGKGFACRVAQLREPVQIERVNESTVVNPLLWEHGLRVLLGVPMVAEGELIGVVHIGSSRSRQFTGEQVESLQLVAGAGTGVGGDWYDVFELPGGRFGVAIGDVVGSGLRAAVVMGRLRSALRAYALDCSDSVEVLGKLDRKASHFETGTMATVAYAVIDTTTTHHMVLALAGHPPPVLAVPGEQARFADVHVGPPISFNLGITGRRSAGVDEPPGTLMVLYTDGLVERRGQDLDDNLERLRQVVTPMGPEALVAMRHLD
jgi:sigma-B regulation protein RsbU (phosphoserine phosphatase)